MQHSCRALAVQLDALGAQPGLQACAVRARALALALAQFTDDAPEQGDTDTDAGTDSDIDVEADAEVLRVAGARTVSTHARGFALRLLPYEIASRFQRAALASR